MYMDPIHSNALELGLGWVCDEWEVLGTEKDEDGQLKKEEVELWRRDPVECVRELMGNPAFRDLLRYAPEKLFTDAEGAEWLYDEMWTGDWWWNMQGALPPGATIAPVILSSDKTQLSRFSGDKQAWPVYLSVGNIPKATRRQPSKHGMILVGNLPVTKLKCFPKGKQRSLEGYQLFHECMCAILKPLIKAGEHGVEITCADRKMRRVHPILAAYIADHPEQCLVSGCQENFCLKCTVHSSHLREAVHCTLKDPLSVWEIIEEKVHGEKPPEFRELGLRLIDPFWRDLLHCDIFSCFTPDLLHQLHKGVFKDHTVSWTTECLEGGADELDQRFKASVAMPAHHALRHFKCGISLVTQWTGTEYKHMEKVFIGAITGTCPLPVMCAVRAVLDFIFYAHFEAHCDRSITLMDTTWATFHENKHIFTELGVRDDYNIPKIHSAQHYALSIRNLGTTDGYNTESSERLHIDYAKRGYAASNKHTSIKQMTTWLNRQEAVARFQTYLNWAEPLHTSTCSQSISPEDDVEMDKDGDMVMGDVSSDINDHGEHDNFPPYVVSKDYLRKASRSRTLPPAAQTLHPGSRFAVYKRYSVFLPALCQVSPIPIKDTIRAVPSQPARPLHPATAAHFDTVLARNDLENYDENDPLHGLCVARVRAIFRIPNAYGLHFKHPVAYVEWFTPFRQPDPKTGMFKVSHLTRNHRHRALVILLTQIIRSCHLLPIWGKHADPTWTLKNVLDRCTAFTTTSTRECSVELSSSTHVSGDYRALVEYVWGLSRF
ncbi:hypothetical protein C8Q76DRAFT_772033 [Earliella scabrosa]|nr:hypothetical protein C8Q76DRAFT_772033 [Earliella scabrosa]